MKIICYKKKSSNIYEVTLSNNEKISLYDDVILKYELLVKKEVTEDLLKEIFAYNQNIESYHAALKYLKSKLRTEKEIRNKLATYNKTAIEYTINRLKEEKYLNDELYIKSYINDSVNLKNIGPNKIIIDLKKLGFNEKDILDYLNTLDKNICLDKINKYTLKKINSNHSLSGALLKSKLVQDLYNKGYLKEDIDLIINEISFDDNSLIKEKEYNKLKNKLSKKYSGEELEYHIKMNMYKKGFRQ